MGLSFTIAAGPRQHSHSQVRVPRDSWSHFTVSGSRLRQLGGPDPRIYIPQEQRDPVIPIDTGFYFVASYDLQGYGGGIRPRLHKGYLEVVKANICTTCLNIQKLYIVTTDCAYVLYIIHKIIINISINSMKSLSETVNLYLCLSN
jgi:hypothetical protein